MKAQTQVDTGVMDNERKYRLGTLYYDSIGRLWKYGKVNFGRKFHFFQWFPWNAESRLSEAFHPTNSSLMLTVDS